MTVAFIPSPKHGIVHIGPLPLHAYGLMLAIGVLVATRVAESRWRRTGRDAREFGAIVVPVVIAGVIGARIYHLFTGYKWSDGGVVGAFEIWKGGLSIWGAVGGGLVAVRRVVDRDLRAKRASSRVARREHRDTREARSDGTAGAALRWERYRPGTSRQARVASAP